MQKSLEDDSYYYFYINYIPASEELKKALNILGHWNGPDDDNVDVSEQFEFLYNKYSITPDMTVRFESGIHSVTELINWFNSKETAEKRKDIICGLLIICSAKGMGWTPYALGTNDTLIFRQKK